MNDFAPAPGFADRRRGGSPAAAVAPDRDLVEPEALVLDLDGYEGPIDLLLSLARAQKLDLAKISILALADQYLDFIAARRRFDLEVAADYLVMAAVLAYLKSCLLLPPPPDDDQPSAQELALALRHRLALLEAMQRVGRRLMARPLLSREVFARGAPEETTVVAVPRWQDGLYELLRAYGEVHRRQSARVLAIEPSAFQSVQEALERLARLLGRTANWRELSSFLPPAPNGEESRRSNLAASFAAALELARLGRVDLRQDRAFGPIWLRRAAPGAALPR
jgi:segregation and condensation protein A